MIDGRIVRGMKRTSSLYRWIRCLTQGSRSTYCDATPSSPYRDIIGFFVVLKLSDRYRLERDVDPADGWLPGSPAKRVANQGWRFPVANENHYVPAFTGFLRSTHFARVANFREKCVIRYGYGAAWETRVRAALQTFRRDTRYGVVFHETTNPGTVVFELDRAIRRTRSCLQSGEWSKTARDSIGRNRRRFADAKPRSFPVSRVERMKFHGPVSLVVSWRTKRRPRMRRSQANKFLGESIKATAIIRSVWKRCKGRQAERKRDDELEEGGGQKGRGKKQARSNRVSSWLVYFRWTRTKPQHGTGRRAGSGTSTSACTAEGTRTERRSGRWISIIRIGRCRDREQ